MTSAYTAPVVTRPALSPLGDAFGQGGETVVAPPVLDLARSAPTQAALAGAAHQAGGGVPMPAPVYVPSAEDAAKAAAAAAAGYERPLPAVTTVAAAVAAGVPVADRRRPVPLESRTATVTGTAPVSGAPTHLVAPATGATAGAGLNGGTAPSSAASMAAQNLPQGSAAAGVASSSSAAPSFFEWLVDELRGLFGQPPLHPVVQQSVTPAAPTSAASTTAANATTAAAEAAKAKAQANAVSNPTADVNAVLSAAKGDPGAAIQKGVWALDKLFNPSGDPVGSTVQGLFNQGRGQP